MEGHNNGKKSCQWEDIFRKKVCKLFVCSQLKHHRVGNIHWGSVREDMAGFKCCKSYCPSAMGKVGIYEGVCLRLRS